MKFSFCFLLILPLFSLSCNRNPKDTGNENHSQIILELNEADSELSVSKGLDLLTIFHFADTFTKPFFFPVNTLSGVTVTRGFPYDPRPLEPVDHPHQTGMWFTFGDVNKTDFWNNSYAVPEEDKIHYGSIHTDSVFIEDKASTPSFFTKSFWIDGYGDTLLSERTKYSFQQHDTYWNMIRETSLKALTKVTFSDNKEGLFAIRVARELQSDINRKTTVLDSMLRPSSQDEKTPGKTGYYFGSNGKKGSEVWGTSNKWVSLSGEKDGERVNIIIFDHPDNFGFPSYWHARDYGLFSVDNFGRKAFDKELDPLEFQLNENEIVKLKHEIWISDTIIAEDKIREGFNNFIEN